MNCTWNFKLHLLTKEVLILRSAAIAFMDNTTWITRSKENMQQILDDAREFYKANDFQINSFKLVLIVINNKNRTAIQEVQAGLNKKTVCRLEKKDFTRFLGVWIGS